MRPRSQSEFNTFSTVAITVKSLKESTEHVTTTIIQSLKESVEHDVHSVICSIHVLCSTMEVWTLCFLDWLDDLFAFCRF